METIGEILKESIIINRVNTNILEKEIGLPKGILELLVNDNFYTNSVPIVLFKKLLVFLNISFSTIEPAMIITFRKILAKETPETIKKKPLGYTLWENEESVKKYTKRLEELFHQ